MLARRIRFIVVGVLFALAPAPMALAHVNLDSPNGGEVLEVGGTFTIEWTVAIQHETENWDLWYSTISSDGPWTEIAVDLPAGCVEAGCSYTHVWTVPAEATSDQVWVRVRQDNTGADYFDVSDGPFAVTGAAGPTSYIRGDSNADLSVSIADAVHVLAHLFDVTDLSCDAASDANGDDGIDISDAVYLLTYLFTPGSPVPPPPFPDCASPASPELLACEGSACP